MPPTVNGTVTPWVDRPESWAVIVATVTDDWQPGYIPPAAIYGQGIYQEIIAAVGPGSLETLIDTIGHELAMM